MLIPDLFSLYFRLYFHNMEFGTVFIGSLLVNESMSYILILHTLIVIINEAKKWDRYLVAVELPQSVNLEVIDTPPAVTGSSATNRSKTAILSTGLEIQVPEYLAPGETVKVNTATGKFMSRA